MGLRRRRKSSVSSEEIQLVTQHANSFPIHYAKRKKPFGLVAKSLIVVAAMAAIGLCYYTYYHFEHFHFNLVHFYAHKVDDPHAQHVLAHKLLKEKTNLNTSEAFRLFRQSANKGNPHSAYNLAAGHLSGHQTDVKKGMTLH
ncbi:hypothetical protein HDE_11790 [Halotydeus destructor]|nr:hypothetical protein HDE_11790 [Halotydeus destructor]